MHARDWFLVFIAVFLPPVAVGLRRGFCSKDMLVNVLLFVLGFFPGLIHALYIISCHPYEQENHYQSANSQYGSV
ncbi:Protein SNA2 [Nakaseomyces bracarensis]|uniref:Protein SNA2 n=1 Tax=Nakaseomyces bracarensis TaxID=273131 RepID=A0ABR4NTQ9_9SACH